MAFSSSYLRTCFVSFIVIGLSIHHVLNDNTTLANFLIYQAIQRHSPGYHFTQRLLLPSRRFLDPRVFLSVHNQYLTFAEFQQDHEIYLVSIQDFALLVVVWTKWRLLSFQSFIEKFYDSCIHEYELAASCCLFLPMTMVYYAYFKK